MTELDYSLTGDDGFRTTQSVQNVLYETHICACLQISDTLPENRDEDAPYLGLKEKYCQRTLLDCVFGNVGIVLDINSGNWLPHDM
jgi:hypothetical protein